MIQNVQRHLQNKKKMMTLELSQVFLQDRMELQIRKMEENVGLTSKLVHSVVLLLYKQLCFSVNTLTLAYVCISL